MLNNDKYNYMAKDDLFSIEEVAKTLKVSYITVYRWIRANKLPSFKAGKQYRIKKIDLDTFLKVK